MALNRLHCKISASILLLTLGLVQPGAAQEPPLVQLTHTPTHQEVDPSWSPDGSQIAFFSDRADGDGDIWVMPASGDPETQLTTNSRADTHPAWSPVGPQIAYASMRDADLDEDIYALTIDGKEDLLAFSGGQDRWPDWAPDGAQIAFASNRTDGFTYRIYVMPATGEPPSTPLTISGVQSWDPAWSPDGTQIAFASDRAGRSDLWVMPAAGEPATRLTDYPGDEIDPSWSPDGTWIAFESRTIGGNVDIWAIPAAGGQPVQLTTHTARDMTPAWSPDGTQIAFASTRNTEPPRPDIWVMELPTLGLESAPVPAQAVRLTVSPNPFRETATIHFEGAESGSSLRILNVAGRLVREIATPAGALSGTRTIVWDGRDAQGQPVAGGVYYLRLEGVNGAAGRAIRVH